MKQKATFSKSYTESLHYPTPFFVMDVESVVEAYYRYHKLFPGIQVYYAMKSNSEPAALEALKNAGCGFEIASIYELQMLEKLRVKPAKIIFGTSVKPASHIAAAFRYGVTVFAADSLPELQKIAKAAPGARVYIRTIVDDTGSVFTMSEKFGAPQQDVVPLLMEAKNLGLVPDGVSFNVGSQAGNAMAWAGAIESLKHVVAELAEKGLKVEILNLGGGFPYEYQPDRGIPTLEEISINVAVACQDLPYQPQLMVEPGRGLVAHSAILVTSVIAKVNRGGKTWLYLDAGTYNALFEAMAHQGSTPYRVVLEGAHGGRKSQESFVLAGPTGDGLDVISRDAVLPTSVAIGSRLVFYDVGAYTFCMSAHFNGFPVPKVYVINEQAAKRDWFGALRRR